jgi:hypothetical protein
VSKTSDNNLDQLRVTQAYVWLLSVSRDGSKPGTVSLGKIGNFEIRMFAGYPIERDGATPVWIELHDAAGQTTVDSCICHEIEDALTVFEDFRVQANGAA